MDKENRNKALAVLKTKTGKRSRNEWIELHFENSFFKQPEKQTEITMKTGFAQACP